MSVKSSVTVPVGSVAIGLPYERDHGRDAGAATRGALDLEPPVERLDPVGEAAEPRAAHGSAPPTPSSATSTRTRPFWRSARTCTADASAYLATFVSASETT